MASREVIQYEGWPSKVFKWFSVVFIAFYMVWTVLPIFIMFMSSFKDLLEAFQIPAVGDWAGVTVFFSFTPTTKHYYELFANLGFSTYLFNSLVAAGGVIVAAASGVFARFDEQAGRTTSRSKASDNRTAFPMMGLPRRTDRTDKIMARQAGTVPKTAPEHRARATANDSARGHRS